MRKDRMKKYFTGFGSRFTVHGLRFTSFGLRGFTLLEAVFIIAIVGIAFFGFGYLFGNVDQEALKSDLTIVATKLARDKMDEMIQTKADSGYVAIMAESSTPVTSGVWTFTRQVTVGYVNSSDLSSSITDTGYKKVDVLVSWGAGAGSIVTLTTLVSNMVPSAVTGPGAFPTCP